MYMFFLSLVQTVEDFILYIRMQFWYKQFKDILLVYQKNQVLSLSSCFSIYRVNFPCDLS